MLHMAHNLSARKAPGHTTPPAGQALIMAACCLSKPPNVVPAMAEWQHCWCTVPGAHRTWSLKRSAEALWPCRLKGAIPCLLLVVNWACMRSFVCSTRHFSKVDKGRERFAKKSRKRRGRL